MRSSDLDCTTIEVSCRAATASQIKLTIQATIKYDWFQRGRQGAFVRWTHSFLVSFLLRVSKNQRLAEGTVVYPWVNNSLSGQRTRDPMIDEVPIFALLHAAALGVVCTLVTLQDLENLKIILL